VFASSLMTPTTLSVGVPPSGGGRWEPMPHVKPRLNSELGHRNWNYGVANRILGSLVPLLILLAQAWMAWSELILR
jgi:hypothetical protein